MIKAANPYLYFDGTTEEAFAFYRSVFGGEFLGVVRFRDFPDNPMGVAEDQLDWIANIALPLGPSNVLMGTDVVSSMPLTLNIGNNFDISLEAESGEAAERLHAALSEGGRVILALDRTAWAEKYGICADRFGVQWMVRFTGNARFSAGEVSG
jgi:PhnB protein